MLFPPIYAALKHSILYDSWRHFLFIYPPMVVLAAIAWDSLWDRLHAKRARILLGAFLVITLLEPTIWMMRFHPHAYTYFNPLVGGLKGAYGRYETDYWGNSLRLASEWLSQYYKREGIQRPIAVRADGELISSGFYLVRDLGDAYVPSPRNDPNWDFWLSLSRGVTPQDLQNGSWPPPGTVHEVKADGITLCAVVRNPERS
jgi:6-pyruvoyl-tetrahydropterin synthase